MEHDDGKKIRSSVAMAGIMLGAMWLIHLLVWVSGIDVTLFANIPRRAEGLLGILTSPWIHDDVWHLLSNSGPLFLFATAMLYFYRRSALPAAIGIWLLSGFWVWLTAHPGAHIGASGIVYGFGAFLFFSGVFRRDPRSISVSVCIAFIYGGMVWGILPGKSGISWESHLFGALAGIAMAWGLRRLDASRPKRYRWEDEPDHAPADENAPWNYRQNWPGSRQFHLPGGNKHSDNPFDH